MQRHITYDSLGNIVADIADTRALAEAQADRIQQIKEACTREIERGAPDFKQRNAALGVYDATKTRAIIGVVENARAKCDALEAQIMACTTNEQVDTVSW